MEKPYSSFVLDLEAGLQHNSYDSSGGGEGTMDSYHHHFLDSCFLCRRSLAGSNDIYMYRGDMPFCSEECRQYQMENDDADVRRMKTYIKAMEKKAASSKYVGIYDRAGAVAG